MLELPEAIVIARQLEKAVGGKTVRKVVAAQSPHGFAWYNGDPRDYGPLLNGQTVGKTRASGGYVEMFTGAAQLIFGEGVNIRVLPDESGVPAKHQLLLVFDDGSALVCTVQMYGAMFASRIGEFENKYYAVALERPSPLARSFTWKHFLALRGEVPDKTSVKAFLATEQRIPGLGNGCLQDILFEARTNPQTKLRALNEGDLRRLFQAVRTVLAAMAKGGGRDTEKDLFGNPGGYRTILSNRTAGRPCPVCGGGIEKKAFLGGKVYFCPDCQPVIA